MTPTQHWPTRKTKADLRATYKIHGNGFCLQTGATTSTPFAGKVRKDLGHGPKRPSSKSLGVPMWSVSWCWWGRRGHLYLLTGIGLSLEVPTCCLESIGVLYSSYPSMIPVFLQETLHFPSHPSLAVSSPALLLKCHLELKGPGVASSVKDICTDMLKYLIHPFPLSLKGPESSLSTTTFQNTFLITICLREQR